jgi:hypothetical protein
MNKNIQYSSGLPDISQALRYAAVKYVTLKKTFTDMIPIDM